MADTGEIVSAAHVRELAAKYGFVRDYVAVCSCAIVRWYRRNPQGSPRDPEKLELWGALAERERREGNGLLFDVHSSRTRLHVTAVCPYCGDDPPLAIVEGILIVIPGSWWPWRWATILALTAVNFDEIHRRGLYAEAVQS